MEDDVSDDASYVREPIGFRLLYQKQLPFPAREGLAAWSPQLDLFAVVTDGENILLYRINGQRVWAVAHKFGEGVKVEHLKWRPDGKLLAVGYSDGKTRIHNVNSGKVILEVISDVAGFGPVTCIGWVDNHSHSAATTAPPETKSMECTPQAVYDMDINAMLPRLCALPQSAGPDSTFTSKTTLDALINTVARTGAGANLEVLLIGEENGRVLLNVFDSFVVGTMELSSLCKSLPADSKLVCHRASSSLSTHGLLLSERGSGRTSFATMDILFIRQFGQYLFQLASTSTKVQALLRYMRETVQALETEFKTMNDVSQRFVSLIGEDLEAEGGEIELEFFEYLVTGIPSGILKRILLDILPERSQKRWEKSSMAGYEMIRRLVHENLLPTCERLTVLLCRLRGLARWKEKGSPLGLEPDDFTRCLDIVTGVMLLGHDILLRLNEELELFNCFMSWLRHSLEQLTTVNSDDKAQEDPQIDTLKVAEFIGKSLKKTCLQPYFEKGVAKPLKEYVDRGENIPDIYEKMEEKNPVPGFMELADFLTEHCTTVFAKPQQAMRQQLRIGQPIILSEQALTKTDMKVLSEGSRPVAYTALYAESEEKTNMIIARYRIDVRGGFSSISKVECANVSFPSTERYILIDMQFVDERLLIVLLRNPETNMSQMVTFSYRALRYTEHKEHATQDLFSFANTLEEYEMQPVSRRYFEQDWTPMQLTVNGKEDRRVGCVIEKGRTKYFVFDLDHEEEESEDDLDDREGDGMEVVQEEDNEDDQE